MKKILLILLTLLTAVGYSQNWIAPGDSIIVRNLKITAFPTSTNGSRSLRVDNNGAVSLDTLAYSDIPVISSFIDKSRICNSSRDDKDAFVTAFAATNKLIVDDGCYYINSTLTIPAGKTLIFEPGGMIAGTGTITGNETEIQAGLQQIFDTALTIDPSGSWKCKEVYAEWFGAKNDGIYNNRSSLRKALILSNLSNSTLKLQSGDYFIKDTIQLWNAGDKEFSIKGNGIGQTYITCDTLSPTKNFIMFDFIGEYNTISINVTKDVLLGDNVIYVDDVSGFTKGDVIFLSSDTLVTGYNYNWGELQTIKEIDTSNKKLTINGSISFKGNYLTSKNARCYKISPVKLDIQGLTLRNMNPNRKNGVVGIRCMLAKDVTIKDVETNNCAVCGIDFQCVYNLNISNYTAINNNHYETGNNNGYGISVNGCMYSDIQGLFIDCRHGITTGVTPIYKLTSGVFDAICTFNLNIHDSYFTTFIGAAMCDDHPGTDNSTIDNCTFVGYSNYEQYNDTVTYNSGDTVKIDNILAIAKTTTKGNNPLEDTTITYWIYDIWDTYAIQINSNAIITNNKFYNVREILITRVNNPGTIHFENNIINNCLRLCDLSVERSKVYLYDNNVFNKYYFREPFIVNTDNNEGHLYINNLYAENVYLFNMGYDINNFSLSNITLNNYSSFRVDKELDFKYYKHKLEIDGLNGILNKPLYSSSDTVIITNINIKEKDKAFIQVNINDTLDYIALGGSLHFLKNNSAAANIYRSYKAVDAEQIYNLNINNDNDYLYFNNNSSLGDNIFNGSSNTSIMFKSGTSNGSLTTLPISSKLPLNVTSITKGFTLYNDTLWIWNGSVWKALQFTP